MNCLARRVLRFGSLPPPRQSLWLCARTSQQRIRAYATDSNGSGAKVDIPKLSYLTMTTSFDRLSFLLSLLKPGQKQLQQSEMSLLIAGLFSSTDDPAKLAKITQIIPQLIEGYDKKEMYARIAEVSEMMESGQGLKEVEEVICNRLGVETEVDEMDYAPLDLEELQGKSPLDQLLFQLERPQALSALQRIDYGDMEHLSGLLKQVMESSGKENMGVLNTIKSFLAKRGLEVVYVGDENTTSNEDNTTSSVLSMDKAELARRVAMEAKLNPLDTPTTIENDPYPNLMTLDPLLDSRDELEFPPTATSPYTNRVIVRNHKSIFHEALVAQSKVDPFSNESDWEPETTDSTAEDLESFENLPLPPEEISNLYKFPLIFRRVTQQTGKGKIHRIQYLVVVGNGDGLVGYGQATDEDPPRALAKATAKAIRSMDTVARFENRTVPTEMETKFGSTRIIMRPRPVGFGLRCNPNLHQILKAAGIKDVSAKVWGSRNPVAVVKAAFRMLWKGHAPLGMGDGIGGKGRKLDKGEGVRDVLDVERERGRKMIGLRL